MEQENQNQLLTIAKMTEQHFAQHPEQPVESIKEYLRYLEPEAKQKLSEALKNSNEYYKAFQEAILHTSFIITLIVQKTINPEIEVSLEAYVREFLFFARKDDKLIYDMRMYYLNNLDAQEMGIGYLDEDDLSDLSETEKNLVLKQAKSKKDDYDKLLNGVKKQYSESKIHLV